MVRMWGVVTGVVVGVCLAGPAWGQTETTPATTPAAEKTAPEGAPGEEKAPPVSLGPILRTPAPSIGPGPSLFHPPVSRGPLTVTPSITISEEYNDNIFLNNRNRRDDFITGFTPGITVQLRRPQHQLTAGYNLTAALHAKETDQSAFADRQSLFADYSYQYSPRLSFTLREQFSYDQSTNAASEDAVASGRRTSWSNSFSPALTFAATQLTTLRVYGSHSLQRFSAQSEDPTTGTGGGQGSDTYVVGTGVDHTFSPRLTGTVGYSFSYFDVEQEPKRMSHTVRLGATYRITELLTGSLSAGPTLTTGGGETSLTPSVTASLQQVFKWGSVSGSYDRTVGTSGGFGGTTENQSLTGTVQVTTLLKGLSLGFTPRYSMSESDTGRTGSRVDIKTLTAGLNASYQLAPNLVLIGSYTFFRQRSDGSGTSAGADVDQNRLFVGVQYGYPINFD